MLRHSREYRRRRSDIALADSRGDAPSYSDVRDAAADAFLRIGESATPYVLEIVRSGSKEQKLDALKLLVRMGRAATGASASLKKALASEGDAYVKEAISDALSRLK